ncbi:MAG: 50S ribosomal protein L6 [Actinobacteria bacterium]|nr:50S ribosomal protein L6 [Actinomycetota bacterium]MBE3114481.1 50S ribosomal protein L6 [Actinomycetota bacterium]MDP3011673.1 50S ribosomal protein L6 [Candidatus Hydromicrobium sp.]
MSRIGRKPIDVPEEVEIKIDKDNISVKGKLGELSQKFDNTSVKLSMEDSRLTVIPVSNSNENRAKHGLYRSLLNNMVIGVSSGFSKTLIIVGVGFRASKKGNDLEILAGYSNPVIVNPLQGISFDVPDNTTIVVKGIDKQVVGEMAAKIRSIRKPEPYKGKGIKYSDEVIRRKVGKTGITSGS